MDFGDILIYTVTLFGLYTALYFFLTMIRYNGLDKEPENTWRPKICIVVPCYNEEKTVTRTVESLLNLDYPKSKLEIIIVDDGSTDNTYKIASKFKKKGVKIFKKANGGKYTALNLGLKNTNADIVGALDADSFVEPNALKKMLPYFNDDDVMAVTPALKIYKPKNWLQRIQQMEFYLGIFLRKVFALMGSVHIAPGPFTMYRKAFFDKYGLYKEAYLTEDIETALRIQKNHLQIENAFDAYVYTHGPDTFKSLLSQRKRWYHGFIQNSLDYGLIFDRKQGNLGMFALPAAFISVFLVIVTLFYTTFKIAESMWRRYVFLRAIDWDWKQMLEFNFDLFFFNFNDAMVLAIVAMIIGFGLILVAKKMASEDESNAKFLMSYVVYMGTYWLFFGFWWMAALYHKFFNKKMEWGHKSGV